MPELLRYPLQAVGYAAFMILVWYFSAAPTYTHLAPDQAVITVAFAHAGARLEECHTLSQAELAKLPPNMRAPEDCPRERSPVTVELFLDGRPVISKTLPPPGLYGDLGIDVYLSAKVPAGNHDLSVHMNDNVNVEGPTYTEEKKVTLEPAQLLFVNFNSDSGQFLIQ